MTEEAIEPEVVEAPETTDDPEDIQSALESIGRELSEDIDDADGALDDLNKTIRSYNATLASARRWLTAKGMVGLANGSDFADLDEVNVSLPSEDQDHADLFRDQLD
jgi:hypothetical protein